MLLRKNRSWLINLGSEVDKCEVIRLKRQLKGKMKWIKELKTLRGDW